jgi:dTDP-glucose pyrophosphorylase
VIEKPKQDLGNLAIGGIYLFDETFYDRLDNLAGEGEVSISDVTRQYIVDGIVQMRNIGSTTWVDCGTPRNLLHASELARDGEISSKM